MHLNAFIAHWMAPFSTRSIRFTAMGIKNLSKEPISTMCACIRDLRGNPLICHVNGIDVLSILRFLHLLGRWPSHLGHQKHSPDAPASGFWLLRVFLAFCSHHS